MSLRNVKTREGYDYWDKLCAITRHAFLFSSCGKRILATPNMGTWIDEHAAQEVVDQAQDEINALRAEVEKLRLQLSACGVAAMANTVNSAEKMRCVNPDFKSGSWQAVCEAVDREMGLRDQRDLLLNALTPQILDWVRCGLATNGRLQDGDHPDYAKLRAAIASCKAVQND